MKCEEKMSGTYQSRYNKVQSLIYVIDNSLDRILIRSVLVVLITSIYYYKSPNMKKPLIQV